MWLLLLLSSFFADFTLTDQQANDEEFDLQIFKSHYANLTRHLFENYDEKVSAVCTQLQTDVSKEKGQKNVHPLHMGVQLYYGSLVKVTETEQRMDVLMDFEMNWRDFRLQWDPEEFGGIEYIYVLRSKIWLPELTPTNVFYFSDIRPAHQQTAQIYYNSDVFFYTATTTGALCPFDMSKFPFDTQTCIINMETVALLYADYVITTFKNPALNGSMALSEMGNGEWTMNYLNISTKNQLEDNPDYSFQRIQIEVVIERNPTYYVMIFMVPSYVINVMSIVGIFVKECDNMARFTVGLTNIMTMTFLLGVLSGMVPRTNIFPYLGYYFLANLGIIVVVVFVVILIADKPLKNIEKQKTSHGWFSRLLGHIRRYHLLHLISQLVNFIVFLAFVIQ